MVMNEKRCLTGVGHLLFYTKLEKLLPDFYLSVTIYGVGVVGVYVGVSTIGNGVYVDVSVAVALTS
jgi:hypothetical protein